MTAIAAKKPNYGIDAPKVLRNLFLFGSVCLLIGLFGPTRAHIRNIEFILRPMFFWTGILLVLEGCCYLFYVKVGKHRHRDRMLALHTWRGDESVLDVGCGCGLLLAGAVKKLRADGCGTGIDIWSKKDMGGNSEAATRHNLEIEGISARCTLLKAPAQEMPFDDATFDVVVSNLCLHNIVDKPTRQRAVQEIVRVLRPDGVAILSDYKLTGEYAKEMRRAGLTVEKQWGNPLYTFPPLRIVIGRK